MKLNILCEANIDAAADEIMRRVRAKNIDPAFRSRVINDIAHEVAGSYGIADYHEILSVLGKRRKRGMRLSQQLKLPIKSKPRPELEQKRLF